MSIISGIKRFVWNQFTDLTLSRRHKLLWCVGKILQMLSASLDLQCFERHILSPPLRCYIPSQWVHHHPGLPASDVGYGLWVEDVQTFTFGLAFASNYFVASKDCSIMLWCLWPYFVRFARFLKCVLTKWRSTDLHKSEPCKFIWLVSF